MLIDGDELADSEPLDLIYSNMDKLDFLKEDQDLAEECPYEDKTKKKK